MSVMVEFKNIDFDIGVLLDFEFMFEVMFKGDVFV